jgi:hypothetical protein
MIITEAHIMPFTANAADDQNGELNAALITQALTGLPPARLAAVELTQQLLAVQATDKLAAAQLLTLAPEVEAALRQAERVSTLSQQLVSRCLALKPAPAGKVPLGF